jgi:hypothetical protein
MALCAFALGLVIVPSEAVAGDRYYYNNDRNCGYRDNNYSHNRRDYFNYWEGANYSRSHCDRRVRQRNYYSDNRWYNDHNRRDYRYHCYQPRQVIVVRIVPYRGGGRYCR